MSVRDALHFIERVSADPELKDRLATLPRGDLDAVARFAASHGFIFDDNELREAFAIDWKMRRRFYGAADAPVRDAGRRDAKLRGPKPK